MSASRLFTVALVLLEVVPQIIDFGTQLTRRDGLGDRVRVVRRVDSVRHQGGHPVLPRDGPQLRVAQRKHRVDEQDRRDPRPLRPVALDGALVVHAGNDPVAQRYHAPRTGASADTATRSWTSTCRSPRCRRIETT